MRRGLLVLGLLAALAGGAGGARAEDEAPSPLDDGAPHRVLLRQGRSTWTGKIVVPAEALALSVVAVADADVDLFLRLGRPVSDSFETEADAQSRGGATSEVLVLEAGGEQGLKAGDPVVAKGSFTLKAELNKDALGEHGH